ncbi:MAG: ATP-binding protein [Gemmatimonadetes bacterium]|nr:ATP-binding protein [Gemmatimonadota bacterium]
MANPFRELFFGGQPATALVEALQPRRTFADVILPPATRRALDNALIQIRKHDLIFGEWGLGERHETGLGLAFNFAGPPGTGKTICAEAVAHALGRRLLLVRYAELESQWAGTTAKNVAAVFRAAAEQEAVLFFDEADAIASRRFASPDQGYQREANAVVNVLLRELEAFPGVVIFATNLAANFDPAFERRIRTHILFEMPGADERARIWEAQIHARRTPLAQDVDFDALGRRWEVSGGDIKNAVLKAAQLAIAEPGPDDEKRIHQRHFETAMEDVVSARRVMEQSLFGEAAADPLTALAGAGARTDVAALEDGVSDLAARVTTVEDEVAGLGGLARLPDAVRRLDAAGDEARRQVDGLLADLQAARDEGRSALAAAEAEWRRRGRPALIVAVAALLLAGAALVAAVVR